MSKQNNGSCTLCDLDGRKAKSVGRCTEDWHVLVCERHLISAAACGFYPKRWGELVAVSPQQAAEIYKQGAKQ